jgi:site-specific recombinase XerD
LRVGEVVSLRISDVELRPRSGWVLVRRGKGQKERKVPLSAEARRALQDYLDVRPNVRKETLFVSRSGKPLSSRDVQRMLEEAGRRAGIRKRVTPHILRHTFATRFLRKGGDIATLAEILGHSKIQTTTRYLHPDRERMQEMVEEL